MKVEVAIIGAGPGGSTLASLLASRGVSVALIDRDAFPRDKLCGEFLSYDAMPVLDVIGVRDEVDRCGASPIHRCRIIARNRLLEFDLPHESRGISRLQLDDLLFRAAKTRGAASFDGWTAERVDGTSVAIAREHEKRTIEAQVIAGAWGRWGRFDTHLGRTFAHDRSHRNFGFKRHYRRAAAEASGTIDLYSFDRGYLGVNDVEGGLTNICGLVHASRLSGHRGRWDTFVETIRAEESRLEALYGSHAPAQDDFLSSEPVIFRARRAVEAGVFMIGDASGVIDPLTGNGMAMAIQSALIAAPRIIRLLRKPADRVSIEDEYVAQHAAMFHPRIRWSRAIASLLSRPAMLDAFLAIGRPPALGQFIVRRTRGDRDRIARLADAWVRNATAST